MLIKGARQLSTLNGSSGTASLFIGIIFFEQI